MLNTGWLKLKVASALIGAVHRRVFCDAGNFHLFTAGSDAHYARQLAPRLADAKGKVRALGDGTRLRNAVRHGIEHRVPIRRAARDAVGPGHRTIGAA